VNSSSFLSDVGLIGILHDWRTIFALLLRDTDSRLMMKELDAIQLSIIFRLSAQSASSLKQDYFSQQSSEKKGSDKLIDVHWQNLQDALQTSVISLLTRFRSEEAHLEIVLELLECYDISVIEGKGLQNLVKTCTELFETLQSESSLSKMGKVIRFWLSNQFKQQKVVISSLRPLLDHSWKTILETIQEIVLQFEENDSEKSKKGKSGRRASQTVRLSIYIPLMPS
jgi:hypothetical protein